MPVHYICAMKIFKFGGASTASVQRIQQLPAILRPFRDEQLLVVVSAMGKTTNALEKVATAFYDGAREEALQLFQKLLPDEEQFLGRNNPTTLGTRRHIQQLKARKASLGS